MKVTNFSYPHPVLGNSDDVLGSYDVLFSERIGRDSIILIVTHRLNDSYLETLIKKNDANFCIEVECKTTLYRKFFVSREFSNYTIEIPANMLRDAIQIKFYITATKGISNYLNPAANADYHAVGFEIEKGDVLAVGGQATIYAKKSWEEITAAASFMMIEEGDREDGEVKYSLNEDKIIIYLSKKDHRIYGSFKKAENFPAVFHSSIALPALIVALNVFVDDENKQDYANRGWFKLLEYRAASDLEDMDWTPGNVMAIAQRILDNPLSRTLQSMEKITVALNQFNDLTT